MTKLMVPLLPKRTLQFLYLNLLKFKIFFWNEKEFFLRDV